MPVIEGTYGPFFQAADPVNGTDETQTLTIGTTPTSGTFKLNFGGHKTPAITWNATTSTLLANINERTSGIAEVQTLTFGTGITGGTFVLRYKGQPTAAITWSSTNNTLRDNIDNALEALTELGTGAVVTAAGTMTNGIGTMTVTFATKGPKALIEVAENRLTGATSVVFACTSERTTAGYVLASLGPDGVVATETSLSGGAGTILLTYSGAAVAKKAQPLMTIESNDLVGTGATLAITAATEGVSASALGAKPNAIMFANGKSFINAGTAGAPSWKQQPYSAVASYIKTDDGVKTLMAASPVARTVMILVVIDETFAAGGGAATVFSFGETDAATKFKNGLNTGTAGATLTYGGTLSAGKALIVTVTARTSTGAGGVSVMAVTS